MVAVKDINLDIKDREFVVLVGPSGCGKSTTLRMIAGLEEISGGTIAIGGRVVNHLQPKDRDIAMVFQNYALYPAHERARQLGVRAAQPPRARSRDRGCRQPRRAEFCRSSRLLDRRPYQLSGGQQQRVALGRCIVRNPKVFLFDEPLSNLDAQLRAQMRLELKELRLRVPTTSIFVTHDQTEAMTLGDRIVVMKDGVVQQVGTPLELYRRPANRFVASFIGSPSMNFIDRQRDARTATISRWPAKDCASELPAGRFPDLGSHVGRSVCVGVRPQHIRLGAPANEKHIAFKGNRDGHRAARRRATSRRSRSATARSASPASIRI